MSILLVATALIAGGFAGFRCALWFAQGGRWAL